ncbi:uncharacterized protein LOC108681864 isoform X2 [Hyalella azteca]|uniref:Uncharacterized protein LOC108681864 isoform X2 n=1 Tax=Hyalella azteca TaxID=294128 RepID=A0A979FG33_HYAAZ|nr:uncharacterized protein LOC108681864 isoform X2 [Hyalella azteca]
MKKPVHWGARGKKQKCSQCGCPGHNKLRCSNVGAPRTQQAASNKGQKRGKFPKINNEICLEVPLPHATTTQPSKRELRLCHCSVVLNCNRPGRDSQPSHPPTSVLPSSRSSTSVQPSSCPSTSVLPSSHPSTSVLPSSHSSTSVLPSSHPSTSVQPSSLLSTSVMPSSISSTPVLLLSHPSTSLQPASFTRAYGQEPPVSFFSSTSSVPHCSPSHSPHSKIMSSASPTLPLQDPVTHECNAANNNTEDVIDDEMDDIDVKDESFSYDDKAPEPCNSGSACHPSPQPPPPPSSPFPPPPPPLECWRPCKTEAQDSNPGAQLVSSIIAVEPENLSDHVPLNVLGVGKTSAHSTFKADSVPLNVLADMETTFSSGSSKKPPVGLNEAMWQEVPLSNVTIISSANNQAAWPHLGRAPSRADELQIASSAAVKTSMQCNRVEVQELSPAPKTSKRCSEETCRSSKVRSFHQFPGFSSPTKTTAVLGRKFEDDLKCFKQNLGSHLTYGLKKLVLQMKTRKLLNLARKRPNSNGPSPKRSRMEEGADCVPCEARPARHCSPEKLAQNRQQATVCLVPSCSILTRQIQQHYQEHHELTVVCAEQLTKLGKDFEELDKSAEHTPILTPEEIHAELRNILTEVMAIDQTAITALTGQLRTYVDLTRELSVKKASSNRDSRKDLCELVDEPFFENQSSAKGLRPRESNLKRYVALCPLCEVPFVSTYMTKHFRRGHQIKNLALIARFSAVAQSQEKLILLTRVPNLPFRTADCVREEDLALLRNESKLVSATWRPANTRRE